MRMRSERVSGRTTAPARWGWAPATRRIADEDEDRQPRYWLDNNAVRPFIKNPVSKVMRKGPRRESETMVRRVVLLFGEGGVVEAMFFHVADGWADEA